MPPAVLHSANLVRFWFDLGLMDAPDTAPDLAVRLASWVDVRQAIQLHQQLGQSAPPARPVRPAARAWGEQVHEALRQLREAVAFDRFAPGLWRNPMPTEVSWQPLVWAELWEPYRRYLSDHQKQMTLVLARLRRQARAALAELGGQAHALARLDAIYDQTLTPKENRLLASLPFKFEQRLAQRVKAQEAKAPSGASHSSTGAIGKPDWLLDFEQELRQSLLAEIEWRSQPVLGLLDAHTSHQP